MMGGGGTHAIACLTEGSEYNFLDKLLFFQVLNSSHYVCPASTFIS